MAERLTQDEFEERFYNLYPNNFTVVGKYISFNHNVAIRCDRCNLVFERRAGNLRKGTLSCPICDRSKGFTGLIIGINDMWTTNPNQASMLLNPEDGYKYTECSASIVEWKCPNCGHIKKARISEVNKRGLSCPICSDGISIPNRFMASLLSYLKIEYVPEFHYEKSLLRYDFYLPLYNIIIEMHGRQHYEGWSFGRPTLEEIQENDIIKRQFALKNNINDYIVINCKNQNYSTMIVNIIKSDLSKFLNFDNVDWKVVVETSMKSNVIKAVELYNNGYTNIEIASFLNVCKGTSNRWLEQADRIGLCNYKKSHGNRFEPRRVVLTNTGVVFNTLSDAGKYLGETYQNIQRNCSRKSSFCGYIDGKPAVWRYYEEYDPNEKIAYDLISINKGRGKAISKYDLNYNYLESYATIGIALQSVGLKSNHSDLLNKSLNSNSVSAYGYYWFETSSPDQPDKTKIMTA